MIYLISDIAEISWDGFTEVLKVAKESSDWNPFLKSALGGVTAVIDLGKVCCFFLAWSECNRLTRLLSRSKGTQRR